MFGPEGCLRHLLGRKRRRKGRLHDNTTDETRGVATRTRQNVLRSGQDRNLYRCSLRRAGRKAGCELYDAASGGSGGGVVEGLQSSVHAAIGPEATFIP